MVAEEVVSTGSESTGSTDSGSSTGSDTSTSDTSPDTSTSDTSTASVTPPAYTPNLKFKVHDKEKEFDASFKEFIKDKKTEDLVRDLYTKADGIDEIKGKYQKASEGYKNLHAEHSNLNSSINNLSKMVAMDDFDGFFQAIKIPEERILRWVQQKLQRMEMPPDQRQVYESNMQAQRQAMALQEQNQYLQQNVSQQQTEFREYQLKSVMDRPDVNTTVQSFDAKHGPGSFRREVVMRGIAHYNANGVDIQPEQAVREVMQLIGQGGVQPTAQVNTNGQQMQPGVLQAPAPVPVIPHVQGRGSSSPVKTRVKSIADLKKAAAAME